ncbi:N-acetylmuramoyl-L-alanine amidase family protein [Perlabentimonas gracilis]|uniref:N-acetylmuramoyl-L-alanine amidase family protein n=1 Tax=Perlabentimonas gracilis TaxID=2715279 RepID=UPI00140C3E73|nr:N-acetylmuramoyl-L-alanine amidase [Perlabentimonas gracilis]NHB68766.1 N-acetylmuramoyl-L-alanine amidase [Perlabentimonas gracilis]
MRVVNKIKNIITGFRLAVVWVVTLFLLFPSVGFSQEIYKLRKVVIDPGHGGRDVGASGKKSLEKDIVLNVALLVGSYIEQHLPDVEVIYTRKTDVFVPLEKRSQIANENEADLFISIHCNANPSRSPYGTETYVMGLHKSQDNLDVAMRENAVIAYEEDYTSKYEGYDPTSAESYIIFSLMQNSFLDQSLNIASLIQDEFRERARRRDRGVKQAGFVVLWQNSMPSVLVELGFLSNPKEEEYLITSEGQAYLASAIFRAFREYKSLVESRSAFTAENQFDQVLSSSKTVEATTLTSQWSDEQQGAKPAAIGNGLHYKVQVTASSNPIPATSPIFTKLSNVEELAVDGLFKYLVGSKSTYTETVAFCQQVREHFPDAFIVAFKDGKQIPLDQARRISSN